MRFRCRHATLAAALGLVLAALPASAAEPTVEAVNVGAYSHYWSPSQTAVATGGTVALKNSTTTPHGVKWVGGPVQPQCSAGVPVGTSPAASGTNWSGTCTFTKPGTYTFYCTVHGPEMTETITVATPGAPTATTGSTSGVSETEATLEGNVNADGKATTYFFEYGETESYGTRTSEESAGEGSASKPVSALVGTLAPGTTYHYRLVAKNSAETAFGVDRTFTTASPPARPAATTGAASGVGETEVTLAGTVTPNGKPTTYRFEWGTTSAYDQTTGETAVGEDDAAHQASTRLAGLVPGTTYHFRIVAKNSLGVTTGSDRTFTTEAAPPTPLPPPSQPPGPAPPQPLGPTRGATTGPPAPATPSIEPPAGVVVTLRSNQRGSAVRGELDVPAADAGARLEVDLLARAAAITGARHSASVIVGRTLRVAVNAGEVTFTVKLDARALAALGHHRRLAFTVRITLKPIHGRAVTATRAVVLVR